MSWLDRRRLLALTLMSPAAVTLSACFQPMLAEGEISRNLRGRIALPSIDGRFGYFLSRSLEDRLGEAESVDWVLSVDPHISRQGLAVAQDNSVTRVTLFARADWQLRKRSTGAVVLSDQAFSQSGYNATTSLFATRQTEQDIERRLARDIGERIARRIYANAKRLEG